MRKGEGDGQPPYPGIIIEDMLDSASMHGGDDQVNNHQVALIEQRPEVKKFKT